MQMKPMYYTFPPETDSSSPSAAAAATQAEVGGKAFSLLECSKASFANVPPGLVLTVSYFDEWIDAVAKTKEWKKFLDAGDATTKEDCDAIINVCKSTLKLSETQQKQLDEALVRVFGSNISPSFLVSVRSSSPEEDLVSSSFAGGYHTTLGVLCASKDQLRDALVTSFASMYDFRVVSYKIRNGLTVCSPKIAIVIQKQIKSDVSGVAFSINPSNNCYDEIMISANVGLGESVVGGTVTPDLYIVDRFDEQSPKIASKKISEKTHSIWIDGDKGTKTVENKEPNEPSLRDEQVLEVAKLAGEAEVFSDGNPVDIEWAYEDNQLYLLQARPVTTYIPLFPELVTPRGERRNLYLDLIVLSQGFSEPMSILGLDSWGSMLKSVKPEFSREGPQGTVWHVNGREYIHLSNSMSSTIGRAKIEKIFGHYDKSLGRAFASINLDDYIPPTIAEGAKGIFWLQLKQLFAQVPKIITSLFTGEDSMKEYLELTEDIMEKCHNDEYMKDERMDVIHQWILDEYKAVVPTLGGLMAAFLSRWRLHRLFSGVEGGDDLLISLCMDLRGNPTSEMGHMMVKLASFDEIQKIESGREFTEKLGQGTFSPEFKATYNEFMKRFGCRGMKEIDMASPRTYEDPEHFFERLKHICMENNAITSVVERKEEAHAKLLKMARGMGKESSFLHHANIIQNTLGYREHPKYMFVVMTDMLRRRALNVAQQFVAEGRLETTDQIFYLTMKQIGAAQADKEMDLLSLVKTKVEDYKKVQHVKNWPVLIDSRGKIIQGVREKKDGEEGVLIGDPISPGVAKARAKVLHTPYEKPLESGEVLVARFTEPSWTPIFINASAVVMEIGGPLQHGSIIAREYGIPCVSGLDDATKLIKDGDLIEVDGSAGTVKILDEKDL